MFLRSSRRLVETSFINSFLPAIRYLHADQYHQPITFKNSVFQHKKSAFDYDAEAIAMAKEDQLKHERAQDKRYTVKVDGPKRRRIEKPARPVVEGTHDEILDIESAQLLARAHESVSPPEVQTVTRTLNSRIPFEVELEIEELSSTGDGLALSEARDHVFVVPFSVPGDRVLVRVFRIAKGAPKWTTVDFLKVNRPSTDRDGVTPGCQYFTKCSGCQFQMLPYDKQLKNKKRIVEKAFEHFSGLPSSQIPPVRDTMGSPLQYGYRTKLTPHFDGPYGKIRDEAGRYSHPPDIGFTQKNMRKVMDIENCPIGTDILQEGLKKERQKVTDNFRSYKNGATILIRESTERKRIDAERQHTNDEDGEKNPGVMSTTGEVSSPIDLKKTLSTSSEGAPQITIRHPTHIDIKTYTSNNDAQCTEYISDFKFTSRAGSFFQNNNSILAPFIAYVQENCVPSDSSISDQSTPPIKYLLDAYCGSGLFTVTLSSLFVSALGIDIDRFGITAARMNAKNNNIPNAGFLEADATDLFADVPFPCDQTLVVIDPPRKGASEDFLRQLCYFGPRRVVYVSCNVHTQARDVGMLVKGFGGKFKYTIESLRGFDFFPQTGHVEGVCVLDRVAVEEKKTS